MLEATRKPLLEKCAQDKRAKLTEYEKSVLVTNRRVKRRVKRVKTKRREENKGCAQRMQF